MKQQYWVVSYAQPGREDLHYVGFDTELEAWNAPRKIMHGSAVLTLQGFHGLTN